MKHQRHTAHAAFLKCAKSQLVTARPQNREADKQGMIWKRITIDIMVGMAVDIINSIISIFIFTIATIIFILVIIIISF